MPGVVKIIALKDIPAACSNNLGMCVTSLHFLCIPRIGARSPLSLGSLGST
jgi:hypothetical protein